MPPAGGRAATVSPPPATLRSFPARVSSPIFFATATVPRSKGGVSKAPSGPFQYEGARLLEHSGDTRYRYWTDIEDHLIAPNRLDPDRSRCKARLECSGGNRILGQDDTAVPLARQDEDVARTVGHVALAKRAADFPALGKEESICHRPGDNEDIDLADQKA